MVMEAYKDKACLDRTVAQNILPLLNLYEDLSGLLVFPHFPIHDVLRICESGRVLPAGVTRSVISPRALYVNYAIETLASDQPLTVKNQVLQEWIQEKLAQKGVRFYQEPTVLFDE
jgi:hypothetical protein